jgi:hypothetical protein
VIETQICDLICFSLFKLHLLGWRKPTLDVCRGERLPLVGCGAATGADSAASHAQRCRGHRTMLGYGVSRILVGIFFAL